MGQSFVPDNRAGAGGSVGLAMVAKAPPDGYTLMVTSPSIALTPLLDPSLQYDVAKDFTPIARLASIENVMLVHPSVPAKTLKEFIALARSRPGKLNYGSASRYHEPSCQRASEEPREDQCRPRPLQGRDGRDHGADGRRGGRGGGIGRVGAAPHQGGTRAAARRAFGQASPDSAGTITSTEAGYPNFRMSIWYGMVGPGGMPARSSRAFTARS